MLQKFRSFIVMIVFSSFVVAFLYIWNIEKSISEYYVEHVYLCSLKHLEIFSQIRIVQGKEKIIKDNIEPVNQYRGENLS